MVARLLIVVAVLGVVVTAAPASAQTQRQPAPANDLKSPSEFQSMTDEKDRSRAIFSEIGRVLTHPRCMSCHPAGDHPLQGADQHEHRPEVWRSDNSRLGTNCAECHTGKNFTLHEAATYKSIPGNERWGLAPLSMAWQGKSLREICMQLKDAQRNGGRDLAALQEHIAKDDLVAWGWNPGVGREPAPGSQEVAGALVQAWIDAGAECP